MTTPPLTRYDFSLPVAQRLSDLTGIKIDLQAVEKVCDRLFEERDKRALDPQGDINAFMDAVFYSDTLYAAAVVRFMRTQATGSRIGIPVEWIDVLPHHLRVVYLNSPLPDVNRPQDEKRPAGRKVASAKMAG